MGIKKPLICQAGSAVKAFIGSTALGREQVSCVSVCIVY